MLDSSAIPNVDHLGLEEPGEVAYAQQMAAREHALHTIFSPSAPPDKILSPSDPNLWINWPGGGVYQYPPTQERPSWHYVTSGLSQPAFDDDGNAQPETDDQDDQFSGLGVELVISTPVQAMWAADVLLNLVRYLLFQPTARLIFPGDRIPCNGPLVRDTGTQLTHLVARRSDDYETDILLPAGQCHLVHLVGSTQGEIDMTLTMGKGEAGSFVLSRVMDELGVGCVSLPDRECLRIHPQFQETWDRIRSVCEAQWNQNM